MNSRKKFWSRMIPVFVVVIVTLILSVAIYNRMVANEEETYWERLEIATRSTAEKIQVRIQDNLNFLDAISDSFILTHNLNQTERVGKYLTRVMENTIFGRIDVILPNGQILSQNGEVVSMPGELNYKELLAKGTHVSPRRTSLFTGKEVIYFFTTIENGDEVKGLLVGTIDCETLGELFQVFTYGGDAQLFMIDCTDGKYLIDTWHQEFGSIQDNSIRQGINGAGTIDMAPSILNGEECRIAYVSNTNGMRSYQYQTPVEDFNWEVCVVVQEDVGFKHVKELQGVLLSAGVIEVILLLLYMAWNMWLSAVGVKSEEKARKLELERNKNEARARFIANMSHDVRTPLNGIVGMLHIIKKHRQDERVVDECLEKIEISTQYLTTLANDMLDINELENNKLVLEEAAIDLREMVKELEVVIESRAKSEKVICSMDCSDLKHPYVIGSEVHIKRILVNLLSNAIKYSKEKGGRVWVTIEDEVMPDNEKQRWYHFVVKDNGIGISEEFQANMYTAFEQEKVTARSDYQGYGLGLTIVYWLVQRMGGTIKLQSKKGEGSTFTVTLPLVVDDCNKKQEIKEDRKIDLSGIHILLAEDNEFNMEIAEMVLAEAGARITKAVNGRIAVELFADSPVGTFNIILMDIMMPELDGCEATKVIRAMDRPDAKTIPIMAMTASTFSEEINRCKDAGMNEHIAKPLDIEKLVSRIEKYCG